MIIHGSILLNTTANPKDIIPRRGLITSAKIQIFLQKCKKMAIFSPFSVLRTLRRRNRLRLERDNAANQHLYTLHFTPYTAASRLHQPTPHFRSNITVKLDIDLALACASVNRSIWLSLLQLRLPTLMPQCSLFRIIQNLLGLRTSF